MSNNPGNKGEQDRAHYEATHPAESIITVVKEALVGGDGYNPPSNPEEKAAYDKGWKNNH